MEIESSEFQGKFAEIFFPHDSIRLEQVKSAKKNFVHYTTANAAMNIIKTRQVWMRQPYFMNDYQEIEHGLQCLKNAYSDEDFNCRTVIDQFYPGLSAEIEREFDTLLEINRKDVYLFCVSEHEQDENNLGRLSMWRAYGKDVGVAIVLNHETFLTESPGIKATLAPVSYHKSQDFLVSFKQVLKNITENPDFIKAMNRQLFKDSMLTMFTYAVLSTKHIGFLEEKEWRIIYSPGMRLSSNLIHDLESINGIPQEVYKIPLKNDPAEGLMKLELNDLIDRIIIGPTNYPLPLYKAFVKMLNDAGVENAANKVCVSDIPLRL